MDKFLKLSKKQSEKSTNKIKVGAVLVKNGKVINKAHNTNKSHPFQKRLNTLRFQDDFFDCCSHTQHAEFKCLFPFYKKEKKLTSSTLFVYRENARGELGNCKPCPACSWLINHLGIKKLVYIDERQDIVFETVKK